MKRSLVVLLAVCAIGPSASALDRAGHLKPNAPAAQHLPKDFPVPNDHEWKGWRLGGFGGPTSQRSKHFPVIFVHGNNTDHAGWYPVADEMTKSLGYRYGDLWALAYNGVGCGNDGALFTLNNGYRGWSATSDRSSTSGCVVTGDEQNVPDLKAFVDAVMRYTHASKVNIVAHSLGVTVARRFLWENPSYYSKVSAFVAIAGADHGTSFCPPGSEDTVESCNEIAAGTAWLAQMNDGPKGRKPGKPGSNETPGPTKWMTVYDGTGDGDPGYAGPTYAQSPALKGAVNCRFPDFYHNDLRVDPRIVKDYVAFLVAVEQHRSFTCPAPPPPGPAA
jgi:pimeloyl-ACP methyl ester carboxylesterase